MASGTARFHCVRAAAMFVWGFMNRAALGLALAALVLGCGGGIQTGADGADGGSLGRDSTSGSSDVASGAEHDATTESATLRPDGATDGTSSEQDFADGATDAGGNAAADTSPDTPGDSASSLDSTAAADSSLDAARDSMPADGPFEACVPTTCAAYSSSGKRCGYLEDGCGHVLYCGSCAWPAFCGGGGGVPGFPYCGGCNSLGCQPACHPGSCASLGFGCGLAGDGCGGILDCGGCPSPLGCGAGGAPYQCGDGGACVALACADQQVACGPAGDGCGNIIQCGNCLSPETCGGGGVHGQCGSDGGWLGSPGPPQCGGLSCADQGIECGPAADGCGNQIDCGPCTPPTTCGGGGVIGKCG